MAVASDLSRADLGAVLKTALDAVVVMRLDGTIAGWNDVAQRTFGWSFADAVGRRMSELIIPHQYREAHERGLAHYLKSGDGPVLDRHIEITALHRDGHELPVELSITHTHQFEEPVFLGFLRDITERQEAQRRQQLLLAELNHRVKNMLAVVAGIAHQTARASSTLETFSTSFSGRLGALARAHEILTTSDLGRRRARRARRVAARPLCAAPGLARLLRGTAGAARSQAAAQPQHDPPRAHHQRRQIWRAGAAAGPHRAALGARSGRRAAAVEGKRALRHRPAAAQRLRPRHDRPQCRPPARRRCGGSVGVRRSRLHADLPRRAGDERTAAA